MAAFASSAPASVLRPGPRPVIPRTGSFWGMTGSRPHLFPIRLTPTVTPPAPRWGAGGLTWGRPAEKPEVLHGLVRVPPRVGFWAVACAGLSALLWLCEGRDAEDLRRQGQGGLQKRQALPGGRHRLHLGSRSGIESVRGDRQGRDVLADGYHRPHQHGAKPEPRRLRGGRMPR